MATKIVKNSSKYERVGVDDPITGGKELREVGMAELRATNLKFESRLNVAIDANVGLRERMQLLDVQVQ